MSSYLPFLLILLAGLAGLPVSSSVASSSVQSAVSANPSTVRNVYPNADQPVKLTPGVPTSGFWNGTHATGAIPDVVPEGAAVNVRSSSVAAGALPTAFSWTGHFGGTNYMTLVRDQGTCGSCYVFASIGDMEAQYQIEIGNPATGIDLSEQNVLQCSGGSCSGGQVGQALDFLKNSGTPDEACNPYNAADHACGTGRCADYSSRTYYVTSWNWIATDAANIKSALYSYGPVVVVMPIFDDFPWSDASFWYYHFYSHQYQLLEHYEWHAVVVVGWNDQGPGTQDDYWIVRNSWGTGGGDIWRGYGGYFYITQDPTTGFFAIPFQQRDVAIIWGVTAPSYAVTFYTDPTSGTITAAGVIKTNGATGTYSAGQRVHVVASPPSGYAFSYWGQSGVAVDNTSSQDTYMTVTGAGWLAAHFTPQKPWASIVSPSGWLRGTVTLTATAGDPDGYVVRVRFIWTHDIANGPFYIIGDDTNAAGGWSILWNCGGSSNNDPSVWVAAVALDNSGFESDWSWSNQFGVDQTPPTTPSLSSPNSGSGTTNPTPTFTWNPASDSLSGLASYTFQIDTSTSFNSGNLRTVTGLTSTSYTPSSPLGIGVWYWRVGDTDNAGNQGSFSTYWSVTIQTVVTTTVTLTQTSTTYWYGTRTTTSTSYYSTTTSTSTIPTLTTVLLVPLTATSTVQSTQYLTSIFTTTVTTYTGTETSTSTIVVPTTVTVGPSTSTATVQTTQVLTSTGTTTVTGTTTTTATSYTETATSTSTSVVYTTVTTSGTGGGSSGASAYLGFLSLFAVTVGCGITSRQGWRIPKLRSLRGRRCVRT